MSRAHAREISGPGAGRRISLDVSGGLLLSPSHEDGQKGLAISVEDGISSMKRTWRVVTAALISSAAVTASALLALPPAQAATATPVPPPPSAALAGTWVNTNHATRNIVDLVVAANARGITVDGFGACTPTPCQWGRIAGTVFGPDVSAATGTAFAAQWNFGFSRTVLLAVYSAPRKVPTLTVREFTTFTDGSHRSNYTAAETFTKGKPVTVTTTGTAAQDYPLADLVTPVASLPAVWINTAASGNVRAVILTLADGRLHVHAYGYCSRTRATGGPSPASRSAPASARRPGAPSSHRMRSASRTSSSTGRSTRQAPC